MFDSFWIEQITAKDGEIKAKDLEIKVLKEALSDKELSGSLCYGCMQRDAWNEEYKKEIIMLGARIDLYERQICELKNDLSDSLRREKS